MNNIIKWVDSAITPPWKCNARLELVETWLNTNVGTRWSEWFHCCDYGYVEIKDSELAMLFKLKFGC